MDSAMDRVVASLVDSAMDSVTDKFAFLKSNSFENVERITAYVYIRANEVALWTVFWTASLSYGKVQFSDSRRTKAARLIDMKFCILDYVMSLPNVPKVVTIDILEAATQTGGSYIDVSVFLCTFFLFGSANLWS